MTSLTSSSSSSSSILTISDFSISNPSKFHIFNAANRFRYLFQFNNNNKTSPISHQRLHHSVQRQRCMRRPTDNEEENSWNYMQSGGIGMALLSMTSTARGRISPFVATLAANPTFVSAMIAWMIAQSMKVFLNFFVERKWDFRILFASGGMPSSHSALCTALTTSVALCHGVADSLFPVCLGFTLIVMYDAIGVRRHAGMQAQENRPENLLKHIGTT